MDQFVIDFGDEPVLAGEEVVLWDREIMVRPPLRNGEKRSARSPTI